MFKKTYAVIVAAVICTAGTVSCGRVPTGDTSPDTTVAVNSTDSSSENESHNSSDETSEGASSEENTEEISQPVENTEPTSQNTYVAESNDPSAEKKIDLSYYEATVSVGETKTYPLVAQEITEVWTSSNTSVATVDKAGNITGVGEGSCVITVKNADRPNQKAEVKVTVKKSTASQSGNDLTYMEGILIANKSYSLPRSYNPGALTPETSLAFQSLCSAAAADGLSMWVTSGFRSYETQEWLYNSYVNSHGQAAADTFSARPGYSEHQTGLAIDVIDASDSFIGTPEAVWLEQHCYEFGFIIRYPKGKQGITGYKYEPWHIRYVGKDFAEKFRTTAEYVGDPYYTLEEYFGIDSYYH